MLKGTTLGRVIQYAKGADLEEVQYALYRITEILKERRAAAGQPAKTKRPRRTKAQSAADAKFGHPADVAQRGDAIGA